MESLLRSLWSRFRWTLDAVCFARVVIFMAFFQFGRRERAVLFHGFDKPKYPQDKRAFVIAFALPWAFAYIPLSIIFVMEQAVISIVSSIGELVLSCG